MAAVKLAVLLGASDWKFLWASATVDVSDFCGVTAPEVTASNSYKFSLLCYYFLLFGELKVVSNGGERPYGAEEQERSEAQSHGSDELLYLSDGHDSMERC